MKSGAGVATYPCALRNDRDGKNGADCDVLGGRCKPLFRVSTRVLYDALHTRCDMRIKGECWIAAVGNRGT